MRIMIYTGKYSDRFENRYSRLLIVELEKSAKI